ncbi:MAG: hypothetical protein PHX86_08210, partial [Caldisericia bacterium]|nr:hypothetical protein [Caldisericia bacterium]
MILVVTRAGLGSISGYELNTKKRTVWLGRQTEDDFIAEGELLEIEPSKEWVFGHTHFVSGKIINHAINISAVGIEPLPVRSWIPGKLNFEMDQVIPGEDMELNYDPIYYSVQLKHEGEIDKSYEVLHDILSQDLRCIDAHVHLGHLRFRNTTDIPFVRWALRNYQVGVAIGDYFLGPHFTAFLPWGMINNRPYLRALQGECLALWALDRFEEAWKVSQRWIQYCPDDNLDMGYVGTLLQKRRNYQEY